MSLNFNRELDVAITAAHRAGGLLRMHFERGVQAHTKSTPFDLVTEADKASETIIVAVLTEAFPNHRILAEEGGGNHAESEQVPARSRQACPRLPNAKLCATLALAGMGDDSRWGFTKEHAVAYKSNPRRR